MRLLLGGYTADMDGLAGGIGVLDAGAPDDVLAGGDLAFAGVAVPTGVHRVLKGWTRRFHEVRSEEFFFFFLGCLFFSREHEMRH